MSNAKEMAQQIIAAKSAPAAPSDNVTLDPKVATPDPAGATGTDDRLTLARRESQLIAERKRLQAERESWEAERRTNEAKYQSDYVSKEYLRQNPLAVLTDGIVTYDQIAEAAANAGGAVAPENLALQTEIRKLQAKVDELSNYRQSFDKNLTSQTRSIAEREVSQLVSSSEEFEFIKASGADAQAIVVEMVLDAVDKGGYLTYEDAAKQVEDYLMGQFNQYTKLKKAQNLLQPEPKVPELKDKEKTSGGWRRVEPGVPVSPKPQQLRTLTQTPSVVGSAKLTQDQKVARAVEQLKALQASRRGGA